MGPNYLLPEISKENLPDIETHPICLDSSTTESKGRFD